MGVFAATRLIVMKNSKLKLRWWQFSLRKFFIAVTLFTVLIGGGFRLREWGRQLSRTSDVMFWDTIHLRIRPDPDELITIATLRKNAFRRTFWIPIRFYEFTSQDRSFDERWSGHILELREARVLD